MFSRGISLLLLLLASCAIQNMAVTDCYFHNSFMSEGAQVRLSTYAHTTLNDEPELTVRLTNRGKTNIFVGGIHDFDEIQLRVEQYHRDQWFPMQERKQPLSKNPFVNYRWQYIVPGQTINWTIPLTNYYVFEAGHYRVTANVTFAVATSKSPLQFTVSTGPTALELY